jgi:hypothetical protein
VSETVLIKDATKQFREDRRIALMSINGKDRDVWTAVVMAYLDKYHIPAPLSEEALLAAVHSMRAGCPDVPEWARTQSRIWLTEHM